MEVATGDDGKINVLPLNQDLFICFYNKELLYQKGFNGPPQHARRDDAAWRTPSPTRRRECTASSGGG